MAYEKVESNNMKFNEIGDFLAGTLVEATKMTKPDAYGKLSTAYKIIADEGRFLGSSKNEKTGKYITDKEPTIIQKGEEYVVWATGPLDTKLKGLKFGTKVKVEFTKFQPSDKGNDAKIKEVFVDKKDGKIVMDEEWLASQNQQNVPVDDGFAGL